MPAITLAIGDITVRQHNGLFSLNDLHKASGGEAKHQPALFMRMEQTQALIAEIGNSTDSQSFKTKEGRNGGTYACRELVIAYAAWISAAFHLKVIRVFLAVATPTTPYSVQRGQTLSTEQAEALRNLLTSHVQKLPKPQQGKAMVQGWSKLKAHFGTDYRHIPAGEFHEAVSIIARHIVDWELVDETPALPHQPTVQEIVADWVRKIEEPNGYPAMLFQPLVDAVNRKSRKRMVELLPGKTIVDVRKFAAIWVDLGKLRRRMDGLGMLESDLPPSWWAENAISPD